MSRLKTVVVAGPTASGKTSLAVELAVRLGGEIICADSMQIYKTMDIATAKPTPEEMRGIKHYLTDFLDPGEEFSVADFVRLAKEAAGEISSKNRLPIICGGTGFYIDSFINNISFEKTCTKTGVRDELKALADEKGGGYLLEMLREFDPETAGRLHENNLARIIRAIEIYRETGVTMSEQIKNSRTAESPYDVCYLVLDYLDREELYKRIDRRVDEMVERGPISEAERVLKSGGLKTSRQAIGYKELLPYFNGEASLESCIAQLKQSTRRYAKRQITWFKRNEPAIRLHPDALGTFEKLADEAEKAVREHLDKED